jgi:serine/threonine protein kinase
MVRVNDHIDKYRLIDKLGGGSFGDVYKAQHTFFTNRIVAIKIMRTTPQNDEERDLFLEEAHFLDALQHPHILSVIDVGTHEGLPYLITEYAANGSLLQRLKRQQGKPFLVEEAVTLLSQIGEALHYAHQQNIVHRDLKPENLLFNAKGEVLIADFGIAKMLSTIGIRQGTTIGTPLTWHQSNSAVQSAGKVTNMPWVVLPMSSLLGSDRLWPLIQLLLCINTSMKNLFPQGNLILTYQSTLNKPSLKH